MLNLHTPTAIEEIITAMVLRAVIYLSSPLDSFAKQKFFYYMKHLLSTSVVISSSSLKTLSNAL
jgi:hypothetical protein